MDKKKARLKILNGEIGPLSSREDFKTGYWDRIQEIRDKRQELLGMMDNLRKAREAFRIQRKKNLETLWKALDDSIRAAQLSLN